jgi:hypothetical protein
MIQAQINLFDGDRHIVTVEKLLPAVPPDGQLFDATGRLELVDIAGPIWTKRRPLFRATQIDRSAYDACVVTAELIDPADPLLNVGDASNDIPLSA